MRQFGWVYQATIVAAHERITLDEVYRLPTIRFLNGLSYLKAKADHEKMLADLNKKKWRT